MYVTLVRLAVTSRDEHSRVICYVIDSVTFDLNVRAILHLSRYNHNVSIVTYFAHLGINLDM